ncbi:hypothetical protein Enr13x_44580 [Stieleria neptunia]|uniref:Uncharacterized protein n=1 Tax=Stieleria neptunia TaxID=2527979 RepID=A0A518HUS4_9BACT|nr:hypothetical protein [Stieleria neptunia]QDV44590.1 hypothetical protein Enr13x_44580 [Stieleria neptunia]
MRFGLRALLVVTAVTALWIALIQLVPPLAFLLFALAAFQTLALPVVFVLIGLTSPQKGTVLDVQSNATFMALLAAWKISVVLCGTFYFAAWMQELAG